MDNASDNTLRNLFDAALTCPAAERAQFLDRYCRDADLRAQVEALLRADADTSELHLDNVVVDLAAAIGDTVQTLPAGTRIGPFELVGLIGEGGYSTVFHARREFEGATQHVALKLLHQNVFG